MQVAIRAKCWDGERVKELAQPEVSRAHSIEQPQLQEAVKRWNHAFGYTAVPVALLSGLIPFGSAASAHPVMAQPIMAEAVPAMAMTGAIKEKILHAFDPLIQLAISLSYPIAGVMIAGGCLFIMVGNRERGMQMLQNAAIGYILVQLSPMFLNLLVGVGETVS